MIYSHLENKHQPKPLLIAAFEIINTQHHNQTSNLLNCCCRKISLASGMALLGLDYRLLYQKWGIYETGCLPIAFNFFYMHEFGDYI